MLKRLGLKHKLLLLSVVALLALVAVGIPGSPGVNVIDHPRQPSVTRQMVQKWPGSIKPNPAGAALWEHNDKALRPFAAVVGK